MKRLLTLIAALCFATEVYAQTGSCFPDADGTRANCGVTNGYVNASGVWLPVSTTNKMPIDVDTTNSTLASILTAVQGALPAGTNLIGNIGGQAASGAASSGNPVRIGAQVRTSNLSTKANGNQVDLIATTVGALITHPYSIPDLNWTYAAASGGILNTTTAVTIAAAAGAGLRNYVTAIDIMAEALGTATEVAIRDGAAGTVIWRTKIGTGGLTGGRSIVFPTPLKSTANTLLEVVTLSASGTGAVYFNAQGYVAP